MANIFTKEDKDRVNAALASMAEVKKEINKAKLANIDMSEPEKALLETEQKLLAIKRVYFTP